MIIEDSTIIAHSKSSAISPSPATNNLGGIMGHIKSPTELNVHSRARQEVARRNLFDNAMKRMQEYLDK